MKPRILFLEVIPTISGGQQVLIDLVPGLSDYDLHALLPGPGPLAEVLGPLGVTRHFVSMAQYTLVRKDWRDVIRLATNVPRLAWHTARLARRLDVDLIYANSNRAFAWGTPAAMLSARPMLWHVHNMLADRKSLAALRLLGHWPVVKRIIAVSEPAAAQFEGLADKMIMIPVGIDIRRFRLPGLRGRETYERVRAELGIPPNASIVGCIGDLIPLKDHRALLDAARRGADDIHYLIVGDARSGDAESSDYATELRAHAGHNVHFLGYRDDIPALLNAMNLLVITSTTETGPRVLLEALAAGMPVVSTPVGRAPALIEPDVTGELFPIGDAAALAKHLAVLLADRQRLSRMSEAAHKLADSELTLSTFQERVRAEIARLLPATPSQRTTSET